MAAGDEMRGVITTRGPDQEDDSASRCLLPHQLDLKLAAYGAGIALECCQRRSVLAGRLKARNCAFGRAHALSDSILSEAGARASLKHLTGDLILQRQCSVGLVEAFAGAGLRKESLVVMRNGFVLQLSHLATPSGACAPASTHDPASVEFS